MPTKRRSTRRGFLKGAAVGVAAVAAPAIVPATSLGKDGATAPSERIVMGALGTGSMGTGDLRGFLGKGQVQMIAVCDVDEGHVERARKYCNDRYKNNDCKAYDDYREMLGAGGLDAVTMALPDHWHALIAVAAAKSGCDIYGQKPLARSIREGRAICDAVHRYGRVWQTGSWQRSVGHFRRAAELVINGRIGKIQKTEVGLPSGRERGPDGKTLPVPKGLNWNRWLGSAPWREFCSFGRGSCHWDWRWILDYSGGQLTDWAGHHIDIAHWGLGLDYTGPVEIQGKGLYPTSGLYDVPYNYRFKCLYANGLPLEVGSGHHFPMGAKWYGDRGWIHVSRRGLSASSPEILKEQIGPDEIHLYDSRDHHQNFLDCVKSRKLTITPVEVAHRSISVGLLGEIAMLTGRKIKWDPAKEKILGDEAASALLGRSYRAPWHY